MSLQKILDLKCVQYNAQVIPAWQKELNNKNAKALILFGVTPSQGVEAVGSHLLTKDKLLEMLRQLVKELETGAPQKINI